jgi:mycoredoxin
MSAVTVYWRPGCMFCAGLFRSLDRIGLEPERVNIWEDDAGAAFVRSVADGNETVPTVAIGDTALVNPTGDEVMQVLAEVAPHEVPDDYEPAAPGVVTRTLHRLLGGG